MYGLSGLDVVERPDRAGVQFSGPQLRPYFPEISGRPASWAKLELVVATAEAIWGGVES